MVTMMRNACGDGDGGDGDDDDVDDSLNHGYAVGSSIFF